MRRRNEHDIVTAATAYHDGLGDPGGPLAIPTQRLASDEPDNPWVREQWQHLGKVDSPQAFSWDRQNMLIHLAEAVEEVRRARRARTVGTLVDLAVGVLVLLVLVTLLVP